VEENQIAMLFTACEEGDADRVYLVLKECTKEGLNLDEVINAQTPDGATPLFYAAKGGNLDAVNVLLKTGRCVVNKGTDAGFTPMWMAALRGKPEVLTVLLQEYGIQVTESPDIHTVIH
jgi:ankyrin repeat protein